MTSATTVAAASPPLSTMPSENSRSKPMSNGGSVPSSCTSTPTKDSSDEDAFTSKGYEYLNPFVHSVNIENRFDIAKIYVLTVLLVPIRVVAAILCLLLAWVIACIGLCGHDPEEYKIKPFSGWRRQCQHTAAKAMRMVYAFSSFHWVSQKGERAPPKEAPLLVVAPHSSYVDSIIVVKAGPPSIVAKQDTSQIPLLGKIIDFAQPIYVRREDPNSRQNTIQEIVRRAHSPYDWPQVVIFPEGTCSNRSALLKFKGGAFYPGVPVQPVIIRYPNKYEITTWTWDGPKVLTMLWYTFASFYNHCEIEYLPVYKPSEAEKADANLYANNVRRVMAEALGVPTTEYSFEDVIMMSKARDLRIPYPGDMVEIEHRIHNLGLLESNLDSQLMEEYPSMLCTDKIDIVTFSELLQIDLKNENLCKLFAILDHRNRGTISLKTFLLCVLFLKLKNEEIIKFLKAIVNLYSDKDGRISRENLHRILKHCGRTISPLKIDQIYFNIDKCNQGFIKFEQFVEYTRELPDFQRFYQKQEQIRRQLAKKTN